MNRTAEKALSIISAVFTTVGIISSFILMAFVNFLKTDSDFRQDIEADALLNPNLNPGDMELFFSFLDVFGGFMWLIIAGLIVSLILIIIGIVNIWNNKNPKLAGMMFIIAGLTGGLVMLPSILLYIAGILCLTKKSPMKDEPQFVDDQYDGTMRPL
ncbi:DUF4064 domain-containing protein [Sporosarcina limicola]|uniref:Phage shock protein PspC (Stress-responsive transcriptional regulator) n=1 Tax=Sporosarcina limicola TaxID=34101 RepID=A0A927MPT3_9BACL|nr:phage shock protein PspC (stress-responsive transcriptional regulator) [Sporosarcina limicola]